MKRKNGNITIEAAVIIPLMFAMFCLIITLLFYYHDKNVVSAITHEALVMSCGKEEIEEYEVKGYIKQRIGNKLFLFLKVDSEVEISKEDISITCKAKKNEMTLNIKKSMKKTDPEKYIWEVRRIKRIIEGAKEN